MYIYTGIDPGTSGAVVFLNGRDASLLAVLPFKDCTLQEFAAFIKGMALQEDCYHIVIEKVHSMPRQGVASSFKFGKRAGEVEGVLAGLNLAYEFVTPHVWQRDMNCLSSGKLTKSQHQKLKRARAQQLYPKSLLTFSAITNDTADAVLIARWLWEKCSLLKRFELKGGKNEAIKQ